MENGATRRGPKRRTELKAGCMVVVTARLPASLVMRLDEECVRQARSRGATTLNRSDLLRSLLERALAVATVLLLVVAAGCGGSALPPQPTDANTPIRLVVPALCGTVEVDGRVFCPPDGNGGACPCGTEDGAGNLSGSCFNGSCCNGCWDPGFASGQPPECWPGDGAGGWYGRRGEVCRHSPHR